MEGGQTPLSPVEEELSERAFWMEKVDVPKSH
jgi:hypothetical protein